MTAEEHLRNSISKLFGKEASKLDLNTFKFTAEMAIKFAESYSESQNKELIEENEKLKIIICNGLGAQDLENDISPMHEI